ncbi:MAG TPA: hypothetical protein VFL62_00675 [Bradyrhizobium sp.]|uniref:hypothetical protein n=1 Tax=Bradyrhizobium sp. TaxID=376 RepID=UPI002D7F8583|nr:hypothetical protein [Bradyrhizobium sp.]HET7884713.1 hypothetical protein [Bradyrhizobium sp.]
MRDLRIIPCGGSATTIHELGKQREKVMGAGNIPAKVALISSGDRAGGFAGDLSTCHSFDDLWDPNGF